MREENKDSKLKIALPAANELPKDFAQACQSRYSPEMDFNSGRIDQVELASLLKESTNSYLYANDLDQEENQKPR
ncbi:hypothetical protein R0J91_21545, partial [Micrococcus sp. SIMBA_131]